MRVIQKLKIQNWFRVPTEVLDHPAHNPDFGSSILHLPSHLKKHVGARSFTKTKR
jgi:hypothetical protein